jgi:phospholipase/carboxylesterase
MQETAEGPILEDPILGGPALEGPILEGPISEGLGLAALSCGKAAYLCLLLPGADVNAEAMLDLASGWAPGMIKSDFLTVQANFSHKHCAAALDRFLDDQLAKRRLPNSHLALIGFSEGARLALQVGLRRAGPLAAIVAISGTDYDAVAIGAKCATPVLLVHGEADPVSPYASMLAFKAALKEIGVPAWSFKRPGLGHALDDEGGAAAGTFLTRHVIHKPSQNADEANH